MKKFPMDFLPKRDSLRNFLESRELSSFQNKTVSRVQALPRIISVALSVAVCVASSPRTRVPRVFHRARVRLFPNIDASRTPLSVFLYETIRAMLRIVHDGHQHRDDAGTTQECR